MVNYEVIVPLVLRCKRVATSRLRPGAWIVLPSGVWIVRRATDRKKLRFDLQSMDSPRMTRYTLPEKVLKIE